MLLLEMLVVLGQAFTNQTASWANPFVIVNHFILQYRASILVLAHLCSLPKETLERGLGLEFETCCMEDCCSADLAIPTIFLS